MKVGDLVRITDQEAHLYGKLGVIVDVRQATAFNGFVRDAYDILVDGDIKRSYWNDEFEVIDRLPTVMVNEPIQPAPGQLRRWLDELEHGYLNDDRNFLVVGRVEDFPTGPSETKPWWILVEGELVSWSYWMILEMSEVIGD